MAPMPPVTKDPKFKLSGTEGSYTLVLTDVDGNDLLVSADTYATLDDVNRAMRVVEDSARLALPLPATLIEEPA